MTRHGFYETNSLESINTIRIFRTIYFKQANSNHNIGLAKKFIRLINILFNKVLGENEVSYFLLKTERTFWPTQYTGNTQCCKHYIMDTCCLCHLASFYLPSRYGILIFPWGVLPALFSDHVNLVYQW